MPAAAGCVGGVLTVENPYIAKAKLKRLNRYLPVSVTHLEEKREIDDMYWMPRLNMSLSLISAEHH